MSLLLQHPHRQTPHPRTRLQPAHAVCGWLGWMGWCTVLPCVLLICPVVVCADVIRLRGGGEVRGEIELSVREAAKAPVVSILTLTGGVIEVDQQSIELIAPRPLLVEEYEVRSRNTENTVDAHWALAEWCREQKLAPQRLAELQQVVELDPSHEKAHLGLGHSWIEGAWVDREEWMLARGYVKHRGRFVTQEEFELLEQTADELAREKAWVPRVRQWTGWLKGNKPDRMQEGLLGLQGLSDPAAAMAVLKFVVEDANPQVRLLGISILAKLQGSRTLAGLIKRVVFDEVSEVRFSALQAIPEAGYPEATQRLLPFLKHAQNPVVNRAAVGLRIVGTPSVTPHLIGALVTQHTFKVRVPGIEAPSIGFSTDGNFAGGTALPPEVEAGLRTGQFPNGVTVIDGTPGAATRTRIVNVRRELFNVEVLTTLKKLTAQDYGYDERAWRLWWAADQNGLLDGQPLK